MKPILRATAQIGASSIISILIGIVSAKAYATMLGPSGLGFMGLLGSLFGLINMLAAMGVNVGLVRFVAHANGRNDPAEAAALRRGAWLVWAVASVLVLSAVTLFREPIGQAMLDEDGHGGSVVLVGVAVVIGLAGAFQSATINAYHRIGALAKIGIFNSVLSAALNLLLVWRWGEQGLAIGMVAGSASQWGLTRYYLRQQVTAPMGPFAWSAAVRGAWSLLRFGVPYTGSMLVGGGVQLLMPILVLYRLDQESVGFYRAAGSLAVVYAGILLGSMAQDFYPRVSAVGHQPRLLTDVANQQHRVVMLLGVPLILGSMALGPYAIPILFSAEFRPALVVFEWLMIGDVLRFSSWTLAYVILASSSSRTFFLTELGSGGITLAASWLAVYWFGLPGLGIAYVISYACYFIMVWGVLRRNIGFVLTVENKLLVMAAMGAVGLGPVLSRFATVEVRTAVLLLIAMVAGVASLRAVLAELEIGPRLSLRRYWRREGVA